MRYMVPTARAFAVGSPSLAVFFGIMKKQSKNPYLRLTGSAAAGLFASWKANSFLGLCLGKKWYLIAPAYAMTALVVNEAYFRSRKFWKA